MTTTIQTRIDTKIKNNAEKVLSSMGLDMTTAIRMFLTQIIQQRKIPFEIKAPEYFTLDDYQFEDLNEETQQALLESQAILDGKIPAKSYTNVDEMFNDILCADNQAEYNN